MPATGDGSVISSHVVIIFSIYQNQPTGVPSKIEHRGKQALVIVVSDPDTDN